MRVCVCVCVCEGVCVCVCERECVLTADSLDGLIGYVSDVLYGERLEAVLLQEVVGAQSQQLQHDAHVTVVVEPVQHPHTRAAGEHGTLRSRAHVT